MIDLEKMNPILEGYKAYFPSHWDDEKYKWEAIKHFQDHWNIDAENFGEMFKQATDKTFNLLASGYAYPRGMITNFAKADEIRNLLAAKGVVIIDTPNGPTWKRQ